MQQVTFAGQTYTIESLFSLSTATLVGLYNSVSPGKPVRRFENRSAAVSRVWKALVDWRTNAAIREAAADSQSSVGQEPAKAIKPTSRVERLLTLLRAHPDGLTVADLGKHLDLPAKRVRDLIDAARSKHGKGIIDRCGKSAFKVRISNYC